MYSGAESLYGMFIAANKVILLVDRHGYPPEPDPDQKKSEILGGCGVGWWWSGVKFDRLTKKKYFCGITKNTQI